MLSGLYTSAVCQFFIVLRVMSRGPIIRATCHGFSCHAFSSTVKHACILFPDCCYLDHAGRFAYNQIGDHQEDQYEINRDY
jgi:hypothetical protein